MACVIQLLCRRSLFKLTPSSENTFFFLLLILKVGRSFLALNPCIYSCEIDFSPIKSTYSSYGTTTVSYEFVTLSMSLMGGTPLSSFFLRILSFLPV